MSMNGESHQKITTAHLPPVPICSATSTLKQLESKRSCTTLSRATFVRGNALDLSESCCFVSRSKS